MSQASFLDSVVTWDDRQCQQNLQEALPKLAEHLQQASIIQEELGILRIICLSFLPWVDIDEAESQVFALVSEKTCDILERLSLDIGMLPKQLSCQQEIHALIELWSELLECFTSCLKFVIDKERVDVSQIHSLPHGAVQLLKGTYSHCKVIASY
ncbi:hypothetical protein DPMN_068212 [Dreissena polymorpha]|uniref:Uncharacterized protein n=1 Tax=Dreissena polymorpha TaxID=45954 RepID=A0A9D4BWF8_DREPO|nr:hypothetical protein DPMN_068212 [Dreissena polymorpha]